MTQKPDIPRAGGSPSARWHGKLDARAASALPPPKPHGLAPIYSSKPEDALVELIDGAYDIIEIWKAESPAQIAWREAWMTKARELGARPSW